MLIFSMKFYETIIETDIMWTQIKFKLKEYKIMYLISGSVV